MTLAANFQGMSARLLTQYGRAATLRRTVRSAGANAYTPTATATDYSVYVQEDAFSAFQIDGTRIQAGDTRFWLSASGLAVEPAPDDQVLVSGVTWRVLAVESFPVQGAQTAYRLHARRLG